MAGKDVPVSLVISAVDNATKRLHDINKAINASPIAKLNNSARRFGDELGLGKVKHAFGEVGASAGEFLGTVGELALKMGALVGIGEGGLALLAIGFGEASEAIKNAAETLGVTTTEYQQLALAAKLAGVDQETFNMSMDKFTKNVGEALSGSAEANIGFAALGVSLRDAHGAIRPIDALLPELGDKLGRISNSSVRNAVASEIFGRSFAKIMPLLTHFNELKERAGKSGLILSPEELEQGDEFNKKFKVFGATLEYIKNVAGAALVPGIERVLGELQKLLVENKAAIVAFFSNLGEQLPIVLGAVAKAIKAVAGFFFTFNEASGKAEVNMGRVKLALLAFAAVLVGPAAVALLSLTTSLATAGLAVVGFGARVLLMAASSGTGLTVLAAIVDGLAVGWGAVAAAAEVAWVAITGPVGLVVAGVGLLIAGGIALYKNWQPFRDLIDGIWQRIIAIKDAAVGFVTSLFGGANAQGAAGTGAAGGAIALGAPLNAALTTQTINENTSTRQESVLKVEMSGVPQGTRVSQTGAPLQNMDVAYRGLTSVGQ